MSYTKGWKVVDTYKGIERADAKVIIVDERGELIGTTSTRHCGKIAAEANARLIASSPLMLATLKDIKSFLECHGYDITLVKQAISQAEGDKPTERGE